MFNLEKLITEITISNVGSFKAEFPRIGAIRSIEEIKNALPINSRGIKKATRFILTTQLKVRSENAQTSFQSGEISIDPQTGNITIHIATGTTLTTENLIGSIVSNKENLRNLRVSHGVKIQEVR